MAILRYVILALTLISVSPLNAETIPATIKQGSTQPVSVYVRTEGGQSLTFYTVAEVCSSMNRTEPGQGYYATTVASYPDGCCMPAGGTYGYQCMGPGSMVQRCPVPSGSPSVTPVNGLCNPEYECPSGQNWTLSGSGAQSICTRPDCQPGETRDVNGVCTSACVAKQQLPSTYGWITSNKGQDPTGTSCDAGCQVQTSLDLGTSHYYTTGKTNTFRYSQSFTGQTCTVSDNKPQTTAPDKAPNDPPKKPPCSASEGVMTSSTGTIACVPEGAPGSTPPIVRKAKQVETNPDGSSKITETITTRDPSTGVESKSVSITITPGSNGQPGTAGTPGTTSGPTTTSGSTIGGDPSKPSDSDFCAKNSGLQICKGGMNEEATQKEVRDALQGDGDYSAINNANGDTKKAEADAAHQAHLDNLTNGTFDSAVSSHKQSVVEAIGSWWEPVPMTGCQPYTATIGARTWVLDICPTAEKISTVSGYALWVFLAFGVLGLFVKRGAE